MIDNPYSRPSEEWCRQAPVIVSHRPHPLCRDGWHAMVLYTREREPSAEYFEQEILGAEIRFEAAPDAPPISTFWELGAGESDDDWRPYLVRFRQEGIG